MLKLKNITKTYADHGVVNFALNGINIEVKEGEFLSIMGPSGCGKTSLINILGLLDFPSTGEYQFYNQEVSRYSEKELATLRKGSIGFVFEDFNLIDELTVFENIELPLLYLKQQGADRKKKIEEVMEEMNISHRRHQFPQQLTGGQQQRVAIARALVSMPRLILADEPTGNLDSINSEEVMKLLTQINDKGTTVIMVTHSPHDASYAHRTINLFDGKIITENITEQFHI